MVKILFVCYGNICRSPMAEFMMKDLCDKKGVSDKVYIESAATSNEEIGNPVHHGTRAILDRLNIDYSGKRARRITKDDYKKFNYIIGMEQMNKRDMMRAFGGDPDQKITLLMDFTANPHDVADPWWTHNFEVTYNDLKEGTEALFEHLKKFGKL